MLSIANLHSGVAMLALFQGTQLSLFESFLTRAISRINSTSITSGMQTAAYVVLLVGFLWQVYQSAMHGGNFLLDTGYAGVDAEYLYCRLDFMANIAEWAAEGAMLVLNIEAHRMNNCADEAIPNAVIASRRNAPSMPSAASLADGRPASVASGRATSAFSRKMRLRSRSKADTAPIGTSRNRGGAASRSTPS